MNNKVFYYIILIFTFFGCTIFEDEILFETQQYDNITPENIITNLKVANLVLNQSEFEEMYSDYDEDIEIEGILFLYKNNSILIDNEPVDIEIKGRYSASYALKSLGVKFHNTFDNTANELIDSETMSYHSLDNINAFRFRNSGNDFHQTMIKDISYTKLAISAGLDLDVTYAEQTVVFINNIFYGIMNLRTEANSNGISTLYNVDKSDITMAKISWSGVLEKKDGDFERIDNLITAIEESDYNYIINEIDLNNFIDYMIFESYIGNRDWPFNNVRFFAINEGPFRFVLHDLDLVSTHNIDKSPMWFIQSAIQNPITDLFNVLYSNPDFKLLYDNRLEYLRDSDLLNKNIFNDIVNIYKNKIEHIIPTQIDKYSIPPSFAEWYIHIEHLKNNFELRENYAW